MPAPLQPTEEQQRQRNRRRRPKPSQPQWVQTHLRPILCPEAALLWLEPLGVRSREDYQWCHQEATGSRIAINLQGVRRWGCTRRWRRSQWSLGVFEVGIHHWALVWKWKSIWTGAHGVCLGLDHESRPPGVEETLPQAAQLDDGPCQQRVSLDLKRFPNIVHRKRNPGSINIHAIIQGPEPSECFPVFRRQKRIQLLYQCHLNHFQAGARWSSGLPFSNQAPIQRDHGPVSHANHPLPSTGLHPLPDHQGTAKPGKQRRSRLERPRPQRRQLRSVIIEQLSRRTADERPAQRPSATPRQWDELSARRSLLNYELIWL